jgi:hypothetical protein
MGALRYLARSTGLEKIKLLVGCQSRLSVLVPGLLLVLPEGFECAGVAHRDHFSLGNSSRTPA